MRHQLGAEELIELGRPVPMFRYAHTPYLAGKTLGTRSQNLFQPPEEAELSGPSRLDRFVVKTLAHALSTLAVLVDESLDELFQGKGGGRMSQVLGNAPALAPLFAEVLVLGSVVLQFESSASPEILSGIAQVMLNASKSMSEKFSTSDNQASVDQAKGILVGKAPAQIQGDLKNLLDASGVSGQNLTPSVQVEVEMGSSATPEAPERPNLARTIALSVPMLGAAVLLAFVKR